MMSSRKRCGIQEKQHLLYDADDKKADLNLFSLELLTEIFIRLPVYDIMTMEKVCSTWKDASKLAWHDIKKYKCSLSIRRAYDNRMLTQSDVEEILLRCGKYLNELILSKVCNSSIMPIVVEHCKNLTKLEFEVNEHLSDIYNINDFVDAFTQLDKLVFLQINSIASNFPVEIINSLPEGIKKIHLFFEKSPSLNSKFIFFDLKKFRQLHSLTLNGCMLNNIIQDISEKITLVYLDLDYCRFKQDLSVFNQLINLEYLNIVARYNDYNCSKRITSEVLSNILYSCIKLKYLKFKNLSSSSTDKLLYINWLNLKNLEYLDCPWLLTKESLINIVEHCQNLKYLELDSLKDHLTEFFIIKSTELKNLECLKLFNAYLFCGAKTISAISNNCKKLKRLEIPLYYLTSYSQSIPNFEELSKLQYLEHLDLSRICLIEDNTITAIANNCKNLKNLNIEFCTNITETGFMALTNLENLQILNVKLNPNVTDNFISKLKRLKSLNCCSCKKLTDDGVIQLIKNCPDLEYLNLGINYNITADTIIAADNVTKNRINDIVLELLIFNHKLMTATKIVTESQWLQVLP